MENTKACRIHRREGHAGMQDRQVSMTNRHARTADLLATGMENTHLCRTHRHEGHIGMHAIHSYRSHR
jgi:hypothetical protein